jgi:anti-sigma factor RsiW
MRLGFLQKAIVCQQAVELISDYLEGALPRRQRERLEAHLRACDGCDEYLRQVQATIRILGNVRPTDLEPETRRGLMDLYRHFRDDG